MVSKRRCSAGSLPGTTSYTRYSNRAMRVLLQYRRGHIAARQDDHGWPSKLQIPAQQRRHANSRRALHNDALVDQQPLHRRGDLFLIDKEHLTEVIAQQAERDAVLLNIA